jgi:hypothetical protein
MGALDRFKKKADELREKAAPMAGSLKEKAERTTESLKGKMNEFGDANPPQAAQPLVEDPDPSGTDGSAGPAQGGPPA